MKSKKGWKETTVRIVQINARSAKNIKEKWNGIWKNKIGIVESAETEGDIPPYSEIKETGLC